MSWSFYFVLCCCFVAFLPRPTLVLASDEFEFGNVIKNFLQGDELKKIQNMYSALPVELRDKLTKDLLANPGKVGNDILNMVAPQFQNLLNVFAKKPGDEKTIGGGQDAPAAGFDFGPLTSLMGNLIGSNPQMLLTVAQSFLENNGESLSFDSIANIVKERFDLDTMLSMASAMGIGLPNSNARGEGGKEGGIADFLQLNGIQSTIQAWQNFVKSPVGQKINKLLPRLLKSESLPQALRLLEKETSFRFDVILRQLQDPIVRKILVSQSVKPIGRFIKNIVLPNELKEVLTKADDLLNKKFGMSFKAKEFIEPIGDYIRTTFKITKESLLDLKPEDVEKIASDILNNEVLEPLTFVWDAYEKARKNGQCAPFIYCQLNHNFYQDNFIKRSVVKTASIISAFQSSSHVKGKDAFSALYEEAYKGIEGQDCTMGVHSFCLDLMNTAAHNEL
jgi:hypothetical protein